MPRKRKGQGLHALRNRRAAQSKDLRLGLSVGNFRALWNQVKHLFTLTASRRSREKNLQRHGDAE